MTARRFGGKSNSTRPRMRDRPCQEKPFTVNNAEVTSWIPKVSGTPSLDLIVLDAPSRNNGGSIPKWYPGMIGSGWNKIAPHARYTSTKPTSLTWGRVKQFSTQPATSRTSSSTVPPQVGPTWRKPFRLWVPYGFR